MQVTEDQAVEMYARFMRRRYGVRAKRLTEEKMQQLRKSGDSEGERVWRKVGERIEPQLH